MLRYPLPLKLPSPPGTSGFRRHGRRWVPSETLIIEYEVDAPILPAISSSYLQCHVTSLPFLILS